MRATCWSLMVMLAGCPPRPLPSPVAVEYNTRCAAELEAGRLDDAEALCDHSLEFCDFYADAQTNKGLIRKLRGDAAGAKGWFIKALRNNADQAQAANNLGVLALEEGKLDQAVTMLQVALRVNPDYAEARANLAYVKLKQQKFAEAEKAYRQLIISAPNLTDAHLGLGRALLAQRRVDEAVPSLERAVLLEPGSAVGWALLAAAQLELGHQAEAEHALARCLDEAPQAPECRPAGGASR